MLCSFIVIVPCKRSYAMPRLRLGSVKHNYYDLSSGHFLEHTIMTF